MDNGRNYPAQTTPATPEDNLSILLREYHQAKTVYDDACHAACNAMSRREQAAQVLNKLSEEVSNAVSRGLNDPTVPQNSIAHADKRSLGNAGIALR